MVEKVQGWKGASSRPRTTPRWVGAHPMVRGSQKGCEVVHGLRKLQGWQGLARRVRVGRIERFGGQGRHRLSSITHRQHAVSSWCLHTAQTCHALHAIPPNSVTCHHLTQAAGLTADERRAQLLGASPPGSIAELRDRGQWWLRALCGIDDAHQGEEGEESVVVGGGVRPALAHVRLQPRPVLPWHSCTFSQYAPALLSPQ